MDPFTLLSRAYTGGDYMVIMIISSIPNYKNPDISPPINYPYLGITNPPVFLLTNTKLVEISSGGTDCFRLFSSILFGTCTWRHAWDSW